MTVKPVTKEGRSIVMKWMSILMVLAPWSKRARRATLENAVTVWMEQAEVRARVSTCPHGCVLAPAVAS